MSWVLGALASVPAPVAYGLVGGLAFGEAALFLGVVLPGETALLAGGALAAAGAVSLPAMVVLGVLAAIAGDSVGYEVGRRFGPRLLASRLGRRVDAQRWAQVAAFLARRGGPAVLLGRLVGVLRALVPTLAGVSRMPYRTFLPWNAAGGLLWGGGCVLAGYCAAAALPTVERWLTVVGPALAAAAGVAALVWWTRRRRQRLGTAQGADHAPRLRVRRERVAVVALLAIGAAAVLAACGGGGTATTATPASTPATVAGSGSASGSSAAGGPGTGPAATESAPAGDIPDTVAYVPFHPPDGRYAISVPEGWSRTGAGGGIGAGSAVTFTDKLNKVTIELRPASGGPGGLAGLPAEPKSATSIVQRKAGAAVLQTFQAPSAPDPVTGKTYMDAVERYVFTSKGLDAVLTLSGPVGADNVDPYRKITDSFRWSS